MDAACTANVDLRTHGTDECFQCIVLPTQLVHGIVKGILYLLLELLNVTGTWSRPSIELLL